MKRVNLDQKAEPRSKGERLGWKKDNKLNISLRSIIGNGEVVNVEKERPCSYTNAQLLIQ